MINAYRQIRQGKQNKTKQKEAGENWQSMQTNFQDSLKRKAETCSCHYLLYTI
jgi:hypothetical protein